MSALKPVLQALVVADHIYTDAATGKKIVCGIFHRVVLKRPTVEVAAESEAVPTHFKIGPEGHNSGSPFAYLALSDVMGVQQFSLRYVRLVDDLVCFKTDFELTSDDRLQVVDRVFALPPLPADLGSYGLEVVWKEADPLGRYRIQVCDMNQEEKKND